MTEKLRVAVVGAGAIGRIHARLATESAELHLVALIDPSPEIAESLAGEVIGWGGDRPHLYGDLGSALSAEALDIVAVCTPSGLHVALAKQAVAAGCNVVIEKPLDVRLDHARELLTTVESLGDAAPVVTVISQHRFDNSSRTIRKLISEGELGRVTSGLASVAWWRTQGYYDSAEWRGTWAMDGGGALMNQGVHSVDLLVWFLGQPVTVQGTTALVAHEGIEIEDVAAATITFESGSVGLVHATTAAYPGLGARLQVMGDEGSAVIENDQLQYVHTRSGEPADDPAAAGGKDNQLARFVQAGVDAGEHLDPTQSPEGHARQYANIIAAIRGEASLQMTVRDAVAALATVHAVYTSALLGQPVSFADVLAGEYDDLDFRALGSEGVRVAAQ